MENVQETSFEGMNPNQMTAIFEAMKQKDLIQSLKVYCEYVRKTDTQLDKGIRNPSKSYGFCKDYIVGRAKRELNSKNGAISSMEVFGWAIHYFTETDEMLAQEMKELGVSKRTNSEESVAQKSVESKPISQKSVETKPISKPIAKKTKTDQDQIDLFSFLGSDELDRGKLDESIEEDGNYDEEIDDSDE